MLVATSGSSPLTAILSLATTIVYAAIGALIGFVVYMVRKRKRNL
jgi:LPXTG-motif cell wall-anchored protein